MFSIHVHKARIFAVALILAGCAAVELPSPAELSEAGGGGKAVVLLRIIGQASEGQAVDTVSGSLSDDNIGLAIGNFETGGLGYVPRVGVRASPRALACRAR
jgi:hypothetical protein